MHEVYMNGFKKEYIYKTKNLFKSSQEPKPIICTINMYITYIDVSYKSTKWHQSFPLYCISISLNYGTVMDFCVREILHKINQYSAGSTTRDITDQNYFNIISLYFQTWLHEEKTWIGRIVKWSLLSRTRVHVLQVLSLAGCI
jgi:hypothetical protein